MKKIKDHNMLLNVLLITFILFFIISLFSNTVSILDGFSKIIFHPSILLVDYLEIAGLSATLLNVTLGLAFNLLVIKLTKVKVNGGIFAGVMIVIGFSFFGKNILNVLPIYLGVYLFSLLEGQKFGRYFMIALFASGLAPIVSFGFAHGIWFIVLGVLLGIAYGFIIPTFSSHAIRFHGGYTLYNIGFAGGVFAILVYGVLEVFNVKNQAESIISTKYSAFLLGMLMVISLIYLVVGILLRDSESKKSYGKLITMSGRAISDFVAIFGESISYMNIGIMGFICVFLLYILQVPINGVMFGGAITVIGFAGFGKHPRNTLPVIAGVLLIGYLTAHEFNSTIIVTALFATALAPIAGDFGIIAGIVAGLLHYALVVKTSEWQGGLNLYNNGFVSGFVAAFLASILDTIHFKQKVISLWNRRIKNES